MDSNLAVVLIALAIGILVGLLVYGYNYYMEKKEHKKLIARNLKAYVDEAKLAPEILWKKVIVAQNYGMAMDYCVEHDLDLHRVVIATSARALEGRRFREKDVIYVGDWFLRPDADEIRQRIHMTTAIYKNKE